MNEICSSNMSRKGFGLLAVIVVIALVAAAGGAVLYMKYKQNHPIVSIERQAGIRQETSGQQTAPTATGATGLTSPKDTSDKALDADTATINAQMNALNSDSVNVDQSLNTTPENLSP